MTKRSDKPELLYGGAPGGSMVDLFAPARSLLDECADNLVKRAVGGDEFAMTEIRRHTQRKGRKRDDSGERNFLFQCRAYRVPIPERQFRILKSVQVPRKDGKNIPSRWFFDFAWPQFGVIVEIDGGIWTGGAHGHPLDLTRNMAKRNDAALNGFVVLAFTPQQVKKADAIQFTIRVLASRGWETDCE